MSQSDRAKSLLRDMESYFGTAREDEGSAAFAQTVKEPDSAKAPELDSPIRWAEAGFAYGFSEGAIGRSIDEAVEKITSSTPSPHRSQPGERKHYEKVRRMEDGNRDEWLYDWVDEFGDFCFFCQKVVDFANFEVHHKNKAFKPLNARENTALSHPRCNRSHREFESSAPQVPRESERPQRKGYILGILDGCIGNPTSKQRALFDEWKMGLATVPSMDDWPFPLLLGVRQAKLRLDKESARRIARIAPYACGLGSSKTYMEYIMEDAESGIFQTWTKGREYWIAYSEDVAHMVAYNLARRSAKSDISTSVQERTRAAKLRQEMGTL